MFVGAGVDVPVVVPLVALLVGSVVHVVAGLIVYGEFAVVVSVLILYRCAVTQT
jgi:hypothetical protein